ncbi:MAG: hypothetical protein R2818_11545 [Flavobacteriales bacterium]
MLQWNALLPLIENALSTGGSTLLVGDAEASVTLAQWRGAPLRGTSQLFSRGDDAVDAQREATFGAQLQRR